MLEALCRQSSTTLDILHAEDGPPITQRTSGLGHEPIKGFPFLANSDSYVDAPFGKAFCRNV